MGDGLVINCNTRCCISDGYGTGLAWHQFTTALKDCHVFGIDTLVICWIHFGFSDTDMLFLSAMLLQATFGLIVELALGCCIC